MKLLLSLLVNGIAVFVTAQILPGIRVDSFITALLVAVVLGVINTFIKPLFLLLTLPINILTLGLFTFVINAGMILLTSTLVAGFYVESFLWALLFSIVISIISSILNSFTK